MGPNILLLVLDSVRARNLSLYGHVNDTTPFLCDFADSATVYTNARAPSIGSRPSHASLFTGHHAAETGVSGDHKLRTGTTIWEALQRDGYDTAVFSDNPFLRSNRYGLIHGFETVRTRPEHYVDVPFSGGSDLRADGDAGGVRSGVRAALGDDAPLRSLLNGLSVVLSRQSPLVERQLGLDHDTGASTYVDAFGEWLADRDGPWAACLNLMDAHYPYEPEPAADRWASPVLRELQNEWAESNYDPAEFHDGDRPWWQLRAFESLYDGSIRQLDGAIERTVDMLDAAGCLDETLLVVTSDHGEGFGERSYFDADHRIVAHGADGGIHDERAHVPLLVKYPGQQSGHRIDRPASLTEFSNIVEAVRDGDADRDAFVPDGPVLVTVDAGYDGTAFALYQECEEGIRMQTVFGSDEVTVVIRDAQTKYRERASAPDAMELADSFSDAELSVSQDAADIDRATRDHLVDLGYVQ